MRFSNPSRRHFLSNFCWHFGLAMYVLFVCAYIVGAMVFCLEYDNYWAAGGFCFVIAFILVRIIMYVTPADVLYRVFPPGGWFRAFYQSFFFGCGWGGFAVGLWLMARGIQTRQRWTGESYFCSMTGVWMAAKWGFFLNIPMYKLREDRLTVEQWKRVQGSSDSGSDSRAPLLKDGNGAPSSPSKAQKESKNEPIAEGVV